MGDYKIKLGNLDVCKFFVGIYLIVNVCNKKPQVSKTPHIVDKQRSVKVNTNIL